MSRKKKIDFKSIKLNRDAQEAADLAAADAQIAKCHANGVKHKYVIDFMKAAIKDKFNKPDLKLFESYSEDLITVGGMLNDNMYVEGSCVSKYLIFTYKLKYSPSVHFKYWMESLNENEPNPEPVTPEDVTTFECNTLGRLVNEAEVPLMLYNL